MSDVLKERLAAGVLIFDGAMGTEIYKRDFFVNTCFEQLCLTAPKVIGEIHAAYRDAGADVMTTNSFGANRNKLSRFGLADKLREINAAAVELARGNAAEGALVAGSVGPVGEMPFNQADAAKIVAILAEHAQALKDAGADFLIFETLPTRQDALWACQAVALVPDIPFMLSFTVNRLGESAKNEPFASLLEALPLAGRGPAALGLNCGEGPEGMLSCLELVMPLCHCPLVAQPNAGLPRQIDGRFIYMTTPEYFTTYATRYVNQGVRGVGGCCGTGPAHIKDLARSVRPMAKIVASRHVEASAPDELLVEPVPTAAKSALGAKIAAGEWVTSVEIVPPRGYDLESTIAKAVQCREAGVDAINIPDGPRASSRMSPVITSLFIQQRANIEVVLHFCCRDRNLIGMQSDMLGCAAAGINNLLIITGDPPKLGDYPFASAVFDADSIGMARVQSRLNRGVDIGGKSIGKPTRALIGVGADPNALDMEREVRRFREKAEAGAEFAITQPVFDTAALLRFMERVADVKVALIAGVWPLASYRNAEFMRNEVPGVTVPDAIMERMARADTKEAQLQEGIAIARESVAAIRSAVQGVQVSAPFGNVGAAIEVIRG